MGKCFIDSINNKFVLNGTTIAFEEFTKFKNGKILTLDGAEIIDSTLLSRLGVQSGKLTLDGLMVNSLDLSSVAQNIIPTTDNSITLGSSTKKIANVYSDVLTANSLVLGTGSAITFDGTVFRVGNDTLATREWVNSSAIPVLKTINGLSIIGTGDIAISGGAGGQSYMDIQYGYVTSTITSIAPSVFVPFAQTTSNGTLDYTAKIDDTTILIKAGVLYKFDGGVEAITDDDTTIAFDISYGLYSDIVGNTLIKGVDLGYEYMLNGAVNLTRNYRVNGYIKSDVDCYLKAKTGSGVTSDSTGVSMVLRHTLTKYSTSSIQVNGSLEVPGYSATETLTEKRWIDGKPIYRKVLSYTPALVNTLYTIDTGLTSVNCQIIFSNIIVNNSGGGQYDKVTSGNAYAYCGTSNGGVYFATSDTGTVGLLHYIVLEYTKSTDTLSSPVVVPVAVNPVMGVTGSVIAFAGTTSPTGYLICDGSLVSRANYATLFSVIGTTYGVGDGVTTFNIPDLRGEFIRGLDGGRGVDASRTIGTYQADSLKSHTHTWSFYDNDGSSVTGDGQEWDTEATTNTPNHLTTFTTGATGATETRPRNIAMNYIIKY